MAVIKAVNSKAPIGTVIDYVEQKEKTEYKLMSGIDVNPETAKDEMQLTKELYGKTGGRTYKHFIQSFAPGENITPEDAHKIACEFADKCELFKGYEVLIVTHQDREHVHTHFVVNSVSKDDGHKFQMSAKDLQTMKDLSDEICREHDLSICIKGKDFEGRERKNITAWSKEKYRLLTGEDPDKKIKVYVRDIGSAVKSVAEESMSKDEFISTLKEQGITTDWSDNHKHITFKDADGNKVRYKNAAQTFNLPFSDKSDEKQELENFIKRNPYGKAVEVSYELAGYKEARDSVKADLYKRGRTITNAASGYKKDTITLNITRDETKHLKEELDECGMLQFTRKHDLNERINQNQALEESLKKHREELLHSAGCSTKEDLSKKIKEINEEKDIASELDRKINASEKTLRNLSYKCGDYEERDASRSEEILKEKLGEDFSQERFDMAKKNVDVMLDSDDGRSITRKLEQYQEQAKERADGEEHHQQSIQINRN